MKNMKTVALATALLAASAGTALATPSTQIWIPSTDIQPFNTYHLNIDSYVRLSGKGTPNNNTIDLGPTVGILPFEKVQAEIGFDYIDGGQNSAADKHPFYFNAKIGTPEDSMFKGSPAVAVGIYNLGTQPGVTTQNISYGLVAKTIPAFGSIPSLGRFSVGGFHGAETVLGKGANNGVLASWDRTMSEISDKLWLAVDYMSGNSFDGALNAGFSWAFSKNVSVIFGYDIYNKQSVGGKPTFTTQVDINFP